MFAGPDNRFEVLKHKALKHGAPSVDKLRFFEDYVISFDTRTKHPEWVLEHISWTDKPRIGDRLEFVL